MIKILLKTHGFIAFISGEPTRGGWFAHALQSLAQMLVILGTAALLTYGVATRTRAMIDESEVWSAIENMINFRQSNQRSSSGEDSDPRETILEELADELGGSLHLALHLSEGSLGYSVLVGIGADPSQPEQDPCAPELVAPPPDAMCLFRVRQLLPDLPLMADFVEFQFPGTAYTIPQLVISAAKMNDSELEFTRARTENVRRTIEQLIGERLFLPSSSTVLWGRRLNGPIQFVTFFLSATALVLILLAWASSVSQNWAVHLVRTVHLPRSPEGRLDPQPSTEPSATAETTTSANSGSQTASEATLLEGADPESSGTPDPTAAQNPDNTTFEQVILTQISEFPTPWDPGFLKDRPLDLSDAQQTADYYDDVSRQIQNDSEVFGVHVDPPVLRFRRAATRAIANTEDTSILPPFLDAQKDSILSFYDARMSIVRFLLWVIPTVGFIGTILGVSGALSSTIGLQSARDLVSGFAQSSVSASMGIAFDTTLVALVAAVAVMLAYHVLQGAEQRMTVLERNRAEEEVMRISKSIRKPGGPADLAQQLISLGINTEFLLRDLKLFQRTGPELAEVIQALSKRKAELDSLDLEGLRDQRGRTGRTMIVATFFAIALVVVLAFEGYLGESIRGILQIAVTWLRNWF